MIQTLSFRFEAESPSLPMAREWTDLALAFLREQGVRDEPFLREWEMVLMEALSNAIRHGESWVRAECLLYENGVELVVENPGAFAGWTSPAGLPEDPAAESGRGAFLLEQYTTRLQQERTEAGFRLRLRKDFAGRPWRFEPGRLDRELDSMTAELGGSYEMNAALVGMVELLAKFQQPAEFVPQALARLCEITEASGVWLRMANPSGGRLVIVGRAGELPTGLQESISPDCRGVEARAMRELGEETIVDSALLAEEDPLRGGGPVFLTTTASPESGGLLLGLAGQAGQAFFPAAQLQIARTAIRYLAVVETLAALQRRRESELRMLRDYEIAGEIQRSLMRKEFHRVPGLDVSGRCQPALQAGGDYFDLVELVDRGVLALVADVMGKGISAALVASMLRTHVYGALALARDPGQFLSELNQKLYADLSKLESFITITAIWISPDRATLRYANAGHPPPVRRCAEMPCRLLAPGNMPLGVMETTEYAAQEMPMARGDGFLLYTDGVLEAANAAGELFGMERIQQLFMADPGSSMRQAIETLVRAVEEWSGQPLQSDDITVLALQRVT